jgi:hypothetical protein
MPQQAKLKRRAFFVDDRALQQAKKVLGVKTDAEVVRLAVERIVEIEKFWQFMEKSRRTLQPGSVEEP